LCDGSTARADGLLRLACHPTSILISVPLFQDIIRQHRAGRVVFISERLNRFGTVGDSLLTFFVANMGAAKKALCFQREGDADAATQADLGLMKLI
jgi:hypothetical protein